MTKVWTSDPRTVADMRRMVDVCDDSIDMIEDRFPDTRWVDRVPIGFENPGPGRFSVSVDVAFPHVIAHYNTWRSDDLTSFLDTHPTIPRTQELHGFVGEPVFSETAVCVEADAWDEPWSSVDPASLWAISDVRYIYGSGVYTCDDPETVDTLRRSLESAREKGERLAWARRHMPWPTHDPIGFLLPLGEYDDGVENWTLGTMDHTETADIHIPVPGSYADRALGDARTGRSPVRIPGVKGGAFDHVRVSGDQAWLVTMLTPSSPWSPVPTPVDLVVELASEECWE